MGLGAEWPDRLDLLVANLGQSTKRIEVSGLAGEPTEASKLDPDPSLGAQWAETGLVEAPGGQAGAALLDIGPYGVARVRTSW